MSSVHVASFPGPSQISWLQDKIWEWPGDEATVHAWVSLVLWPHMPGFKATHTRSQCSQSLLQILRYIARKHNLCMLLCVCYVTYATMVYVTLCYVTYATMVYVLQYLYATSVVVLIHGMIILCNPLQPTETVSCKYPLLLWISWNCTTKIFRPNFSTRIST